MAETFSLSVNNVPTLFPGCISLLLTLYILGRTGRRDDIANVPHAGGELHRGLEAQAEAGAGDGAAAVQICECSDHTRC